MMAKSRSIQAGKKKKSHSKLIIPGGYGSPWSLGEGVRMSKIQWTDRTQNPVKRKDGGNYCELTSPGCANCYASLLNSRGTRFGGNGLPFGGANQQRPEMTLNVDMLQGWARMRKEHKIFVGSMTDLFGEWIPDWMLFTLLDAMAKAPRQTFQILTKRPERAGEVIANWLYHVGRGQLPKNIWLGTSAENQATYDERSKWLARCLAQVRFLSLEPLLGPIDIANRDLSSVDWVIIGGESGPHARPMDLAWVEDILDQCRSANIPAFVKQLGSRWAKKVGAEHGKGGDPDEWPEHLRVRMFPGEAWK
jgi:protein gp37